MSRNTPDEAAYRAEALTLAAERLSRTNPDEDLTGIFTQTPADLDLIRRIAGPTEDPMTTFTTNQITEWAALLSDSTTDGEAEAREAIDLGLTVALAIDEADADDSGVTVEYVTLSTVALPDGRYAHVADIDGDVTTVIADTAEGALVHHAHSYDYVLGAQCDALESWGRDLRGLDDTDPDYDAIRNRHSAAKEIYAGLTGITGSTVDVLRDARATAGDYYRLGHLPAGTARETEVAAFATMAALLTGTH